MKTKMNINTANQYLNHIANISHLANVGEYEAESILNKLTRLEKKINRIFTADCNGESNLTEAQEEARDAKLLNSIKKMLPNAKTLFLNGDPRGYSIKISSDEATEVFKATGRSFHCDWGGYGILAPDFNN